MAIENLWRSSYDISVRPTLIYERALELSHRLYWKPNDLGLERVKGTNQSNSASFEWVTSVRQIKKGRERHAFLREYWCKREQVFNILFDSAMQAYQTDCGKLLSSLTGVNFRNATLFKVQLTDHKEFTGVPDSVFLDMKNKSIAFIEMKIQGTGAKYSIDQHVKYATLAALLRTESFFPGFRVFQLLFAPSLEFKKNVSQFKLLGASSNSAGPISFSIAPLALKELEPTGHTNVESLIRARLKEIAGKGKDIGVARTFFEAPGILFFPWSEVIQRCPKGLLRDNFDALKKYIIPDEPM